MIALAAASTRWSEGEQWTRPHCFHWSKDWSKLLFVVCPIDLSDIAWSRSPRSLAIYQMHMTLPDRLSPPSLVSPHCPSNRRPAGGGLAAGGGSWPGLEYWGEQCGEGGRLGSGGGWRGCREGLCSGVWILLQCL